MLMTTVVSISMLQLLSVTVQVMCHADYLVFDCALLTSGYHFTSCYGLNLLHKKMKIQDLIRKKKLIHSSLYCKTHLSQSNALRTYTT